MLENLRSLSCEVERRREGSEGMVVGRMSPGISLTPGFPFWRRRELETTALRSSGKTGSRNDCIFIFTVRHEHPEEKRVDSAYPDTDR